MTEHLTIEGLLADRTALRRRVDVLEAALRRALGMIEHLAQSLDWTEEESAQAQAVWGANLVSIRAVLAAAEGK